MCYVGTMSFYEYIFNINIMEYVGDKDDSFVIFVIDLYLQLLIYFITIIYLLLSNGEYNILSFLFLYSCQFILYDLNND